METWLIFLIVIIIIAILLIVWFFLLGGASTFAIPCNIDSDTWNTMKQHSMNVETYRGYSIKHYDYADAQTYYTLMASTLPEERGKWVLIHSPDIATLKSHIDIVLEGNSIYCGIE